MPFKSQAQKAWMYKNKPKLAARWEMETPRQLLPKRVSQKPRTILPRLRKRK